MSNSRIAECVVCAVLMLASSLTASAQPESGLRPSQTVLLYADSFEGNVDLVYGDEIVYAGFKMAEETGLTGQEELEASGSIGNISDLARVDIYLPKKGNGKMAVVCPGGGYRKVSSYIEGLYVAEWLVSKGIGAAVVKYRMPEAHWEVPLEDVQNVFRYCRANASRWGISTIGVMGFSAGGHLAACASNMFVDEVTRPDFAVLVYPVISFDKAVYFSGTRTSLIGTDEYWDNKELKASEWMASVKKRDELVEAYSMEKRVTSATPPTFLAHCTDDNTSVDNSLVYYKALLDSDVPVEMHIYTEGGHGWGFTAGKAVGKDKFAFARDEFYASLERWLKSL